MVCVYSCCSDI